MLGPADAISRLADLLNTTAISVRYYTLLMQKDERRLWPKFGRGNKASVGFRPLLNLWLAYILSNGQPPAGVRAAYEFSRLKLVGRGQKKADPLTPGPNALLGLFNPVTITETRRYFSELPADDYLLIDVVIGLVHAAINHMLSGAKTWGTESDWPVISITLGSPRRPMSAEVTWLDLKDPRSSETDYFALDEGILPELEAPQVQRRTALPETQIVIRRDAIIAFAMLAVDTEDFSDLLRQTFASRPASRDEEGTTPETKEATGPASHGDLDVEPSASRAYPALVPTASLQEQSATKEGSRQSLPNSVGRESRVRSPATRKDLHHENWAVAS